MRNPQKVDADLMFAVALRGQVVFPGTAVSLDIGRPRSINAVKQAMEKDQRLFVVAQKDVLVENPGPEDLYEIGTVVKIRHIVPSPNGQLRILVEGEQRALFTTMYDENEVLEMEVLPYDDAPYAATPEIIASTRVLTELAVRVLSAKNGNVAELKQALNGTQDPSVLCDVAVAAVVERIEARQQILECERVDRRLDMAIGFAAEEVELQALQDQIQKRVHEAMDKANHDYYLREEMRVIQEELNEDEDEDIAALRKRVKASKMPDEVRERVEKELKRLARTAAQAPESAISENYIEYILELPWGVYDETEIDVKKARKVLEADHYGMREVKDRLLEYLAVRARTEEMKSPIICLVGPPGVGKTSIARSVARALNRKFAQMSLGGVHDEAEIRGHRKTYVSAMPGRLVSTISHVKTMNPVFLLDEIDKMAHDMRGDPASAMLEALDPEQNKAFRDHYLEVPFDLSDVLFITTANTTDTIDRALLDRMEVIEVPSYTINEKLQIAKKYLLPKQLKAHGLEKTQLKMSDKTLTALIDSYTRESGVRTLERTIGQVCRKAVVRMSEDATIETITLKPADLKEYLGAPKFLRQEVEKKGVVGVVNGLAWTSVGGEVMPVEAVTFDGGHDKVEITGNLGNVMKESASLAKSAARARLSAYGVDADFFEKHDLHIHVPEGATPKDGPSAGVALTCAVMSAVTGIPADNTVAMTGEITLQGKVVPIGGVKEKLLAAYRLGIRKILLPKENVADLEKIDAAILEKMEITPIGDVNEALKIVLLRDEVSK